MTAQLMQACAAAGLQDMDHSALVQALEGLAQHAVAGGG
jgi:2-hydroxy-3-oxopropionate reductase